MSKTSRRQFMTAGLASLSALAMGELLLREDARATEKSGTLGDYANYLGEPKTKTNASVAPKASTAKAPAANASATDKKLTATEDNILGPFYRPNAPFRAKVPPPMEPGVVVVVSGRVWALDTRKPLADTVIDIWQANAKGRYDNDDPSKPPAKDVFLNRARLITDENGYYEFETIHPGQYRIGPETWRPSHIHYMVRHPGYKPLVTQLYFAGDSNNATDAFIKQSLIVTFVKEKTANGMFERGRFDIVLPPERKSKGRDVLIRPYA